MQQCVREMRAMACFLHATGSSAAKHEKAAMQNVRVPCHVLLYMHNGFSAMKACVLHISVKVLQAGTRLVLCPVPQMACQAQENVVTKSVKKACCFLVVEEGRRNREC